MTTTRPAEQSRERGLVIAMLGTAIWASTGIFIDYLLGHYNLQPLTLAFWRDVFTAIALFAVLAVWQPAALRIRRGDLPFLLLFGMGILAAFNAIWTLSISYNGGAVATVLAYSAPGFTALLAWPLLGERPSWQRLAAVAVSLAGCVLVAGAYSPAAWQANPLGILLGLASGLAFSFYTLAGRWSGTRFPHALTIMAYGFLFAAATLFLTQLQAPAKLFSLGTAWDGWLILALLAAGPTLGGYGLYTLSLRYLEAGVASLIASLEPVFTALMSIVLLHKGLSAPQWLGTGLVLLAVVLVQARRGAAPAPVEP